MSRRLITSEFAPPCLARRWPPNSAVCRHYSRLASKTGSQRTGALTAATRQWCCVWSSEGAPVSPLGQLYRCEGARLGRRYPAADLSRLDWMIVLSVARAFRDAMAEELARAMRAAWGWPSAGTWGTTSRAWWGRRWRWQGGSTMRDSEQRAPVAEDEHHDVAQRHDGRILALVAAFSDTSSLCECHRSRAPAASEQARCWPVRRARRRGGRRGPRLSPREADGLSLRGAQEPCAPAAGGAAREVLTDEYDAIEKLWGER